MLGLSIWVTFDLACGILAAALGESNPADVTDRQPFTMASAAVVDLFRLSHEEVGKIVSDMTTIIAKAKEAYDNRPPQPPDTNRSN
jgi:hypothetical protein